jgi:hypothetical protein
MRPISVASITPSMAGPWFDIYDHYYTTVAGAKLKRHQCDRLLECLEIADTAISLHCLYFSSGASLDADIAASAREEAILNTIGILMLLKDLAQEVWFPTQHQAFKQFREYLCTLEPNIDHSREKWEAELTLKYSPKGQEEQLREYSKVYRILLRPCLQFLVHQLSTAFETPLYDGRVWTRPTVGQAYGEVV